MDWIPKLDHRSGPKYLGIANAIEEAIEGHVLLPGDRLPTHRALAEKLLLSLGTVTRGYDEAERRGLIHGVTGKGTFVRSDLFEDTMSSLGAIGDESLIDLSLNVPPIAPGNPAEVELRRTIRKISGTDGLARALKYQPHEGHPSDRGAGSMWLARIGLDAAPERLLITAGVQHGLVVALSTMSAGSTYVATEELTDAGIKDLARMFHLRLAPVDIDSDGMRPDSLESVCRATGTRVVILTPTLHNPTGVTMSEKRRREIGRVARKFDLIIIEDDVFGMVPAERPEPLASLVPERTFYLTSFSKSIAPGLRVGYMLVPSRWTGRMEAGIRATTWMAPTLESMIVAEWIRSGTALELVERTRSEISARIQLIREHLPLCSPSHSASHVWVPLPDPWSASDFVREAQNRNVLVTSPEVFAVGRERAPHAVRICMGGARTHDDLAYGLDSLAGLLESR